MSTSPELPKIPFKDLFLEILQFLINFVKNPVSGMRHLPDWNWPTLILTHASLAAIFGILSGVFLGRISKILNGFIALPISTIFVSSLLTLFFYYTFLFFWQKEIAFKKLYSIIMLASLPWLLISPLMDILSPLKIAGLICSGLLLVVGLHEHTQLKKRQITRLVVGMIGIYTAFWVIQMIQLNEKKKEYRKMATPQSLDILEKEFSQDSHSD